ncbi:hypothetical protein OAK51_05815 [Alphaproteobacteria bacterium]|nr:hypothetical protein [Alphaproteobacteria bacterium]
MTDFSAMAVCTETTNCSSENNQFPNITTGQANYNTALGYFAGGTDITTGDSNTILGSESGKNITTGNYNTAVGADSILNLDSGSNNTAVGYRAGSTNVTGSGNIFIGNEAGPSTGSVSNKLYIANSSGNSPLVYGDFSNNTITVNDNLVITGTFSDGNYTFDTNGNVSGLGTINSGTITSSGNITSNGSIIIGNANITESELETIDGVTAGTVSAVKAVVVDINRNISGFNTLSATTIQADTLSASTIQANTFLDSNNDRFIFKDTANDIVHIGSDSMLFYDSSTYGKDIMASSTGHVQIGNSITDTTTIMGDLIIQEPTKANHAATRRYADKVSLMATTLDTRLPLYGNKHSLNLSSASTNNETAFGLNFVGIYDGLHLPLDFSFGSAFSGDYNMGKLSVGMSW